MSTPQPTHSELAEKLPRWQFRKKKKLDKRRKKRQENAEKNKPTALPVAKESEESPSLTSVAEKQRYEQDKRAWEEKEGKFKLLELAKKKAREREERAKALAKKRWQDTLMTLPMLPPHFSIKDDSKEKAFIKDPIFKTFVQSNDTSISTKKTYRERFLERKLSKQ